MVKAEEHASGKGTQKVDLSDVKNSDIANAIDEYIHSERDRKILKRRLIDGICYEPLAEEMGMSVVQIKRIVSKAEAKLFKHI
ncbi:MAG: sigma-70 family RNA polymerase sigma factor [Ruminococcus sp.]|nr:sigma-70 family RNA polymerase sigma factor [Ruminococcus sp.]